MKKFVALLTVVMILARSGGMTASAATTSTCTHPYLDREMGEEYITTSTHSVQVGKTSNGKDIHGYVQIAKR